MMLSIFLPSVYVWEGVNSNILLIYKLGCLSYWVVRHHYMLEMQVHCWVYILQFFSQNFPGLFIFVTVIFWRKNIANFGEAYFIDFKTFIIHSFVVKDSLPDPWFLRFSPTFSSKDFIVWNCTLWPIINYELTF